MSGRRWTVILLAAGLISATGCQVDGGATKLWNPFVRADKTDGTDAESLPKFVRRVSDGDDETKRSEPPIAESRVEALLAEGQRGLQENRIPEARRAYNEVLQFLPDDPTAHHGLAMAADLTENWAEAEDHYRQALRARPRDANLLCDIGYSYLLQNRYSEAASYLAQAVQINPNHENAHANLALLDVRQGNREAARERLTQRYGDSAKVTQILAALDSKPALQSKPVADTAASLTAMAPALPANASFDEIREIARRERIAAEQRRAAIIDPADQNSAIRPVSATHPQGIPGPPGGTPQYGLAQHPNQAAGSNADPAIAGSYAAGIPATGNSAAGSYPPNTEGQLPTIAPAQFGSPSAMPSRTNSMPANSQFSSNPGQPGFNDSQQFAAGNIPMPPAVNPAVGSGGVIAVRPSGAFQPPAQGASYGQPIGFGQPPVNTAGYQSNGDAGSPVAGPMYGNPNAGYPTGSPASNMLGQLSPNSSPQYPNAGQNNSHVQLDGLNAGPGSLFPIGQGAGSQEGQLRMGNVSAPGSNSVINGAMYGQPMSTLPSQEWMMQQQQQIQQLRSQPQQQQFNQNGLGYAQQSENNQGYSNPQYAGNTPNNTQYGIPNGIAGTTAPRPGHQPQSANPLSSYENQLRQLDNQYNNTLQQLDRNATATVPRAQY